MKKIKIKLADGVWLYPYENGDYDLKFTNLFKIDRIKKVERRGNELYINGTEVNFILKKDLCDANEIIKRSMYDRDLSISSNGDFGVDSYSLNIDNGGIAKILKLINDGYYYNVIKGRGSKRARLYKAESGIGIYPYFLKALTKSAKKANMSLNDYVDSLAAKTQIALDTKEGHELIWEQFLKNARGVSESALKKARLLLGKDPKKIKELADIARNERNWIKMIIRT